MTVNPEVYELARVAADNWRAYAMNVIDAAYCRSHEYVGASEFNAYFATLNMQAAMRAEIRRKALLKGRRK